MEHSTASTTLRDSLDRKRTDEINIEDLPKDIQHKIKLIEKAFK